MDLGVGVGVGAWAWTWEWGMGHGHGRWHHVRTVQYSHSTVQSQRSTAQHSTAPDSTALAYVPPREREGENKKRH